MTDPDFQPSLPSIEKPAPREAWIDGLKLGALVAGAFVVLVLPTQLMHMKRNRALESSPSRTSTVNYALGQSASQHVPRFADFAGQEASEDARFVANWVADSNDNGQLSFVIIDKRHTRVFVFDPAAKLLGATPVLLGAMPGDDSVIGIGKRPISQVRPEERTTPAGRFRGEPGRNATGEDVVWVDYDAAVSMHRVRIVDPKERRLERLATPTTDDNRISYGCVNIPVAFFEGVLSPVFKSRYGIVYVLPEVKQVRDVFTAAYDPAAKYASTGFGLTSANP
jgi:hypothetical protein